MENREEKYPFHTASLQNKQSSTVEDNPVERFNRSKNLKRNAKYSSGKNQNPDSKAHHGMLSPKKINFRPDTIVHKKISSIEEYREHLRSPQHDKAWEKLADHPRAPSFPFYKDQVSTFAFRGSLNPPPAVSSATSQEYDIQSMDKEKWKKPFVSWKRQPPRFVEPKSLTKDLEYNYDIKKKTPSVDFGHQVARPNTAHEINLRKKRENSADVESRGEPLKFVKSESFDIDKQLSRNRDLKGRFYSDVRREDFNLKEYNPKWEKLKPKTNTGIPLSQQLSREQKDVFTSPSPEEGQQMFYDYTPQDHVETIWLDKQSGRNFMKGAFSPKSVEYDLDLSLKNKNKNLSFDGYSSREKEYGFWHYYPPSNSSTVSLLPSGNENPPKTRGLVPFKTQKGRDKTLINDNVDQMYNINRIPTEKHIPQWKFEHSTSRDKPPRNLHSASSLHTACMYRSPSQGTREDQKSDKEKEKGNKNQSSIEIQIEDEYSEHDPQTTNGEKKKNDRTAKNKKDKSEKRKMHLRKLQNDRVIEEAVEAVEHASRQDSSLLLDLDNIQSVLLPSNNMRPTHRSTASSLGTRSNADMGGANSKRSTPSFY